MTRKEAIEIVEKYIESFEGGAAIYEALTMAADALKNEADVIDMVLEIIDSCIENVEALRTGRESVISKECKECMLLEARIIRIFVEALRGERE